MITRMLGNNPIRNVDPNGDDWFHFFNPDEPCEHHSGPKEPEKVFVGTHAILDEQDINDALKKSCKSCRKWKLSRSKSSYGGSHWFSNNKGIYSRGC